MMRVCATNSSRNVAEKAKNSLQANIDKVERKVNLFQLLWASAIILGCSVNPLAIGMTWIAI